MHTVTSYAAIIIGFLAAPALAQTDGMELQRCIWQCLSQSSGNDDPAYHACVERVCVADDRPAAVPPTVDGSSAKRPDRNTITFVQQSLTDLGFDPGPVDGVYGRKTEAAIRAFLAGRGLPMQTGIDDVLISALNAAPAQSPRGGLVGAWLGLQQGVSFPLGCRSGEGVRYSSNGTYMGPGMTGSWQLHGDQLAETATGAEGDMDDPATVGQTYASRIVWENPNTFVRVFPDGRRMTFRRCPPA